MANNLFISLVFAAVSAFPCLAQGLETAASSTSETADSTSNAAHHDVAARPLFNFEFTTIGNVSTGDFAPYYIASNSQALTTQGCGIQEYLYAGRELSHASRFEYGFGAAVLTGYTSAADYLRYSPEEAAFREHGCRPSAISLRQLWAGVKYRSLFIYAGMKSEQSALFNSRLGSGDLVMSENARPIPQIRAGFIDFQDIPLTHGWVQIQGELAYGKFVDSGWLEDHYDYYNSFITTGAYMHYSRLHLRSNPEVPFSVTIGMQQAAQFGGTWQTYSEGVQTSSHTGTVRFKDFVNALLPWTGGSSDTGGDAAYYSGNHLGSWDLMFTYRFSGGSTLKAYMQSPWEDGSGIGKLNGWDGVWGLEYRFAEDSPVLKTIVAEYIDFTNQSGPMHWAPGDFPGTQVEGEATGADDYYNNYMYNGWTNYGMAIGTPFVKSPIYNTDGYMRFTDNRVRGFHIGADGILGKGITWRALLSYRTSWGTPFLPAPEKRHDTSMLIEAAYSLPRVPGLALSGALAFDAGSLYGSNVGAIVKLKYTLPIHCK